MLTSTRHHYSDFTAKIHWLESLIALNPLQESQHYLARRQGLSGPLARSRLCDVWQHTGCLQLCAPRCVFFPSVPRDGKGC